MSLQMKEAQNEKEDNVSRMGASGRIPDNATWTLNTRLWKFHFAQLNGRPLHVYVEGTPK